MKKEDSVRRATNILSFVEISLKNGNRTQAIRSIERLMQTAYSEGKRDGRQYRRG